MDQVLEPAAAETLAVEAGLDGEHVAGDDLLSNPPEAGELVHLESDAVPETVEEALLQHLPGHLRKLGLEALGLEELADRPMRLGAPDPGADGRIGEVEPLANERVIADELLGRLAQAEGAGHVRVTAGGGIAREEVDDDRLALADRPGSRLVADGRVRPAEMRGTSSTITPSSV